MEIIIKLNDGTCSKIQAWYHPSYQLKSTLTEQSVIRPAGIWTTNSVIMKHLAEVNKIRRKSNVAERDLSDPNLILGITGAEVPLEIYCDCEDHEPWKHWGLLIKSVSYQPNLE
jgi:hypothetical protein